MTSLTDRHKQPLHLMIFQLTKKGEHEAREPADSSPHLPAELGSRHRVHRYAQQRHQELAHREVDQKQVKISPQLKHEQTRIAAFYRDISIP